MAPRSKDPAIPEVAAPAAHKFDPRHMARLDHPGRARWQPVEPFLELLHPRPGMVFADVGSGPGYFALAVAGKIGAMGTVYGIDVQPQMLEELERRARARGLRNVVPVRSGERGIPLPDIVADAACTANTFHELESPAALLDEIRRILKPGCRLFVIDWKPVGTPVGPPVRVRVAAETIRKAMREAGFVGLREHPIYPYHHVVEGKSEPELP